MTTELKKVPILWEALEDAFENNAPEVHSYLNIETGEVVRVVDGVAEPGLLSRIQNAKEYLRAEPVSSREQYRWMERFIASVEDTAFRQRLLSSIDGKGAFRRFKDLLMHSTVERERWFTFRSERLRAVIETWLAAHNFEAGPPPEWSIPKAEDIQVPEEAAAVEPAPVRPKVGSRSLEHADAQRQKIREIVDALPNRDLDMAATFLEYLRDRRHPPRPRAKAVEHAAEYVPLEKEDTNAGASEAHGTAQTEVATKSMEVNDN